MLTVGLALLSLAYLALADMGVDTYVLGGTCTCSDAPGNRAEPDDTAVVTGVSGHGPNNTATVSVFESADDAALAGKHYVALASGDVLHSDLLDATALGAVLSRRRREATGCSKGLFDRRFAYDWRLAADAVAAGRYYVAVASGIAIHADILDASALGDPLSRRRRESSDCSMVSFKSRFALG